MVIRFFKINTKGEKMLFFIFYLSGVVASIIAALFLARVSYQHRTDPDFEILIDLQFHFGLSLLSWGAAIIFLLKILYIVNEERIKKFIRGD